jgi:hypothetical protein
MPDRDSESMRNKTVTLLKKVNLTAKVRSREGKFKNREGFSADSQHGYLNSSAFLGGLRGEKRFLQ